jgi:hypothetical protein
MARKFIVTKEEFRMGNVEFHKELDKGLEHMVLGGGMWHMDDREKILYLWGSSIDYGYAEPRIIKHVLEHAWLSPSLSDFKVMHSPIHGKLMPEHDTFTELIQLTNFSHI